MAPVAAVGLSLRPSRERLFNIPSGDDRSSPSYIIATPRQIQCTLDMKEDTIAAAIADLRQLARSHLLYMKQPTIDGSETSQ